jgi:hypothetical protein
VLELRSTGEVQQHRADKEMVSSSDRELSGPSSVNGSPCSAPAPIAAWDAATLHIIAACRKREQPCGDAPDTEDILCKRPRSSEDAPTAAELPTCIAQVGTSSAAAAAFCPLSQAQKLPRLPRLKLRIKLPGSNKPTSSDELSSSPDGSSMSDSASQQQCQPEPEAAEAAAPEALETSTPEQVQEPAAAAEDDAADAAAMLQAAIAPEQVQPQQQPQAQQEPQQQAQAEPAAQSAAQPLSVLDAVLAAGGWDSYVQQKAWQQQDNPYLAQPWPQHQHQQAEEAAASPHHQQDQQQQPLGALGDGLGLDQAMGCPNSSSSALLHPLIPAALGPYDFPYACYGPTADFSAFVTASPDQSSDQCDMDSEDGDDYGYGGEDSDDVEYDLFGDITAPAGAHIVPTAQLPCLSPASALLKPALKKCSTAAAPAAAERAAAAVATAAASPAASGEAVVEAAASGDAAASAAASPAAEAADATCPATPAEAFAEQQAGSSVPAARARVRFHACLEHVRVFDKKHPACCHL